MSESKKFETTFKIFKPRQNGEGAASQWEFNPKPEKRCMFLESAPQKNIKGDKDTNASFDWDNKITMKLGLLDMGEILATFTGLQKGAGPLDGEGRHKGIYHQPPGGNKNTILQIAINKSQTMYYLRLSQKSQGQEMKSVEHAITFAEASVLAVLLRRAIEVLHGWGWD